jgi:hypothetical protein
MDLENNFQEIKNKPISDNQNQIIIASNRTDERKTLYKSTYPKGGVSFSKESFVVNQTFVFQFKFCGKSHSPRVAANR